MTKMLTLFGEDIGKLKYNDLKRERKVQKYLYAQLQNMLNLDSYRLETLQKPSQVAKDKVTFLEIYLLHLEALINEIDYWIARRAEPMNSTRRGHVSKTTIRTQNIEKRKAVIAENARLYKWEKAIERDGFLVSWDKERFLSIASDRGYQTQEALIQDVGKELNLDKVRAERLIDRGRFTWGQVLCLGAMLQTTPKEFCDTFLNGYFVDRYGEFRASYDNISRTELLRTPIRPMPTATEELDVVEVGADGKPLDEEIWFD